MIKTLIHVCITLIAICIFMIIIVIGINRQMKHECLVWQEQAQIYPNYYYTDAQKTQCNIK
jgi:hypothetical protein